MASELTLDLGRTTSITTRTGTRREGTSYMESSVPIGLVAAATVAAAVLVLDWIAGRPLATPSALGAVVFRGEAFDLMAPVEGILVFGYTLLHSAAFVVAATAAITVERSLRSYGLSPRTQFFIGVPALFACLHLGSLTMLSILGISFDAPDAFGVNRLLAINGLAAMALATSFFARAQTGPDPAKEAA